MKMQEMVKLLGDLKDTADLFCVEFEDLKELIVFLQKCPIAIDIIIPIIADLQEVENLTL